MPIVVAAGIAGAATLGSAAIASSTAKKNNTLAQQTAAQNANIITGQQAQNTQLLQNNQQQNAGLLTGTALANQDLIKNTQQQNQGVIDTASEDVKHQIAVGSEGINSAIVNNRDTNNALWQGTYDRGQQAGQAIQALLGLSGDDAAAKAFDTWRNSTGYKFQLQSGSDAITANKATAGLLKSGGTLKALDKFGQDLGSTYFGNYYGMLNNQQNAGLTAAQAMNANNNFATSAYQQNTANNVNMLVGNRNNQANATLANNNNAQGLSLNNATGTTNALVGNNNNTANTISGLNTSSANALVGNNSGLAQTTAANNNAAANATTGAISGLAGNLISAYGYSQGASSYQPQTNRASGVNYI